MAEYLYIYITYTLNKEEQQKYDFIFKENDKSKLKCILSSETNLKNINIYHKIFKIMTQKNTKNYSLAFETNEYRFIISL